MSDAPRLYSGERQFENFCRMGDFYPTSAWNAAANPQAFPQGPQIELPELRSWKDSVVVPFNGAGFGWGDLAVVPFVNGATGFGFTPAGPLGAWLERANARDSVSQCREAYVGCAEHFHGRVIARAVAASLHGIDHPLHVRPLQGRRIVHAITGHGDHVALCLQRGDQSQLVLG